MSNYVLGLDLGPASIGWAAIEVDGKGNPTSLASVKNGNESLLAIGSRVFEAGVDNLGQGQREEPKNKKRREQRSIRRNLRRKKARKLKLLGLLRKAGIIEVHTDIGMLQQQDPYELRSRGLGERLKLSEIGRVILHMARRRGFKSNRKQPEKDSDAGKIKEAIMRLEGTVGNLTLGQFWYQQRQENIHRPIRNRRGNYNWVGQRSQYQQELALIFEKQSQYYPGVLTKNLFDEISKLLFDQIRFELSRRKKKRIIGMCSLITGQLRCPLSDRIAQEFRLLQKINDLRITAQGIERQLTEEQRLLLYNELMNSKERTFTQIRKLLSLDENYTFNFEHQTNNKLPGNVIDGVLAGTSLFGKKQWRTLSKEPESEETKQQIWDAICNEYLHENSELTADAFADKLESTFGLKVKKIEALKKLTSPIGNVNFSKKALLRILPHMRKGLCLHDAIKEAGFTRTWRCLKQLPLPDKSNGFQSKNPVVTSVLFQLRKIVNALIKELGKPEAIVVETTRDLKASAARRAEIIKTQKQNQNIRTQCEARIREYTGHDASVNISLTDITKYRLWEEQNHFCPYSCKRMSISDLLSRETEIDHILPRSMSLDNSLNNKVVCYAKENQGKGQRTPIDWLGENSSRYQAIKTAIDNERFGDNPRKWERFFVKAEEIADKYTPERLLQDTSYIATEVRDYLKKLYPHKIADQKVRTTKGTITSQLRGLWDLNPILRQGEEGPKNRDDLRHHALDAAVVAVTSQGMIKRVTDTLSKNWPSRPSRIENIPQPWEGFDMQLADAIWQINVSHRVQRKVKGQLHEETFYNKEENGPNAGKFITRKTIDSGFKMPSAKKICDPTIRDLVINQLNEHKDKPDKAFEEPLYLRCKKGNAPAQIKSVRIATTSNTMVNIRDNIWVEPGSNHHVEIFGAEINGKPTMIRKVYTTLEVAQRLKELANVKGTERRKRVIITRENPFPNDQRIKDVTFLMSLSIGETVLMKNSDDKEVLARVKKISPGSIDSPITIDIWFWEIQVGRIEGKVSSTTPNVYRIRAMADFARKTVRKVTIDPLGRVRRAND